MAMAGRHRAWAAAAAICSAVLLLAVAVWKEVRKNLLQMTKKKTCVCVDAFFLPWPAASCPRNAWLVALRQNSHPCSCFLMERMDSGFSMARIHGSLQAEAEGRRETIARLQNRITTATRQSRREYASYLTNFCCRARIRLAMAKSRLWVSHLASSHLV
jgi:hypothetical protein